MIAAGTGCFKYSLYLSNIIAVPSGTGWGNEMAEKKHLTTRLSVETIERIKSMAERDNISIDDLLMNALVSHKKNTNAMTF